MVFETHTIYIQGAGGLLERTVRDSRSDRELSARDLIEARDKVRRQYDDALALRQERLKHAGAPAGMLALAAPERLPFMQRMAAAWNRTVLHQDPLERFTAGQPLLRTEADMWDLERLGLRRRIAGLSVEIHKKFSLPAACIVFVLIGAPLGMRVRRAGPAVAFLSIGFFIFYYLCLVGGEDLANRLLLPPWFSMWMANLVLGGWGVYATLDACELLPRRAPARRAPSASPAALARPAA